MKLNKTILMDDSELAFGDFNVFVGGNGVGKTTFVVELFHKASELPRDKYYWIKETGHSSHDVAEDLRLLNNSLARRWDGSSLFFFSNATRKVDGSLDLSDDLRFSAEDRKKFEAPDAKIFNDRRYRRPFLSFSSCESRLSLPANAGMTALDQTPQDPINVLYRNRTLQKDIDKSVLQVFIDRHFHSVGRQGKSD
jgi:hypothetical protein